MGMAKDPPRMTSANSLVIAVVSPVSATSSFSRR